MGKRREKNAILKEVANLLDEVICLGFGEADIPATAEMIRRIDEQFDLTDERKIHANRMFHKAIADSTAAQTKPVTMRRPASEITPEADETADTSAEESPPDTES